MASRERCPQCGSTNITGRAYDLADGDEYQERYCFDCRHAEDRLRSAGGVSWYVEVPPQEPHRMFAATGVERTLLDLIYAAPDDDGPRAVYADWLLEHGDPLGTFISLQLARAARRDPVVGEEEQRLLDAHWSAWIGAPSSAISPQAIAYERGLWSHCGAFSAGTFGPALAHAPAWATVRDLRVGRAFGRDHLTSLLAGPIRRSLRSIHVLERAALDALSRAAGGPPLAIHTLAMELDTSRDPPSLAWLRSFMPALHTIDLPCLGEFAPRWIERADVVGLPHLVLEPAGMLLDLHDVLRAARKSRLAKLSLRVSRAFTLHLDRDADSLAIRSVELHPHEKPHDAIVAAKKRLDELAPDVDPGVKMTMQTITPELAQFAERRGVHLVRSATRFAARPS